MGWTTDLWTNIEFNKQTYNAVEEVHSELNNTNETIDFYEHELKALALITEPKKYCDKDDDPISFIINRFNDNLEELRNLYVERFKLSLLLDSWDRCHDERGFAIAPPKGIDWRTAFLDGDFIEHDGGQDNEECFAEDEDVG